MEKSKVSVVVPVYNSEGTIERCVQSILAQTWPALEVLAVDDGSTDRSSKLLDAMAAQDARLKVLHQQNSGVSAARNMGIEHATGEYLQFVDSDDTLVPDATERMVHAMEKDGCDLAIAPYVEIAGDSDAIRGKRGFIREACTLTLHEFMQHMSLHPNSFYYAVLWNKLYRRSLVEQQHVRCDSRFPWGEDFDFNNHYHAAVTKVAVLAEPVYYYHRKACGLALDSVRHCVLHPIHSIKVKWWLQQSYEQLFRETGLYDEYRHVLKRYLFGVTISG